MRNAYFTLATDDYALGAYCLAKSINKVSNYRLNVIDVNISEENKSLLKSVGCELIKVEYVGSKTCKFQSYRENPNFANNCYNKIYLWNQDLDKIIYLDADTLVLKNIDHLFDLDHELSAGGSFKVTFCTKTKKPLNAGWDSGHFNAGVLVLKPNKKTYSDLMVMKDTIETPNDPSDQGLLNHYFQGRWNKLNYIYNFTRRVIEISPQKWNEVKNNVCVFHYTLEKPWSEIHRMWWSVYNS
jgi:glycogenin glucosyltransferase